LPWPRVVSDSDFLREGRVVVSFMAYSLFQEEVRRIH
jgi:hypothetical protein